MSMDGTQTFTEATSEIELNRWTIHSFVEIDHDGSLYHPLTDRRIPTGSDHHGALQPHGAHAALLVRHPPDARNHTRRGRWLSWKIVPAVTEMCARQPRQTNTPLPVCHHCPWAQRRQWKPLGQRS